MADPVNGIYDEETMIIIVVIIFIFIVMGILLYIAYKYDLLGRCVRYYHDRSPQIEENREI